MDGANVTQATLLASIVIANIGVIIGGYVSMKVAIAKLEVKVDTLSNDVNALGGKVRQATTNT